MKNFKEARTLKIFKDKTIFVNKNFLNPVTKISEDSYFFYENTDFLNFILKKLWVSFHSDDIQNSGNSEK